MELVEKEQWDSLKGHEPGENSVLNVLSSHEKGGVISTDDYNVVKCVRADQKQIMEANPRRTLRWNWQDQLTRGGSSP
jgi:hypothetical protein